MGENTADAMATLGGRGMAEDRSRLERSSKGGCRASAADPEVPGEATGGLDVIESNQGSGKAFYATRGGVSHELIPWHRGRNLVIDGGGMRRAPRRPFNESSDERKSRKR